MKQYNVFTHPDGRAEAVKVGFSYPAFFFHFIWAFIKRMWKVGFIVLAAYAALRLVYYWMGTQETSPLIIILIFVMPAVYIAGMVLLGMKGNEWYEDSLKARGFAFKSQVAASDKKTAAGRWHGETEAVVSS